MGLSQYKIPLIPLLANYYRAGKAQEVMDYIRNVTKSKP